MYSMVSSSLTSDRFAQEDDAPWRAISTGPRLKGIEFSPASPSAPVDQAPEDTAHRHRVGRDVRLLEHAGHALDAARAAPGAPDEQVDQPGMGVGAIGFLVHVEARLEREDARRVVGADRR